MLTSGKGKVPYLGKVILAKAIAVDLYYVSG